ncbi:hypothetical protein PSI19_02045 [Xenorhabdus khoisanae]|nr:hypothetical protein [Xenorhabdus khoisanae]MDC9612682.1 hypothetical protein [Xenorhabdus khoisanae]
MSSRTHQKVVKNISCHVENTAITLGMAKNRLKDKLKTKSHTTNAG